jgi:hypothetical protein
MMTCLQMAARLRRAAIKAKGELDIPTETLMLEVSGMAKAVIGTYAYGWPQLAASTQAERVRLGFMANDPLERTFALGRSINGGAILAPFGAEGAVFSTTILAYRQECGTSRGIPPRPFLMASMIRCAPAMRTIFTRFAEELFL